MIHGRGATVRSILDLSQEFGIEDDIAYVAPQAAGNSWYPNSFLAPLEHNELKLSSALRAVTETVEGVRDAGLDSEQTLLLGFSQGACLTLEYAVRNRVDMVEFGFSGGLIGPDGTPREYDGTLDGVPVFLGCSDTDPHILVECVHESSNVFRGLEGDVTERIYEEMAHTVNNEEMRVATDLIQEVANNR
jgi:predicted esterase